MEREEFLRQLESDKARVLSGLSYELLHIPDLLTLKDLSGTVPQVEAKLKDPGSVDAGKTESLKRILSFLKPIARGKCRCVKYRICSYSVFSEQKKGLVRILSEDSDTASHETKCFCECVLCKQRFAVREFEAGFGRRSKWREIH